jgi:hypothetical protein
MCCYRVRLADKTSAAGVSGSNEVEADKLVKVSEIQVRLEFLGVKQIPEVL